MTTLVFGLTKSALHMFVADSIRDDAAADEADRRDLIGSITIL